jgi:hypothetical protein
MTTMRPIKDTIPLEEARAIIAQAIAPIERTERIPILGASGRAVSRDVTSDRDVPPFSRAAMDGYAVVAEDTFGASRFDPKTLRVVEKVYTGQVPGKRVGAGECVEIATGAPMPEGADAVVMVEESERAGDTDVHIFTPVYPRQNVGKQGADIVSGQTVVRAGDVLNPSRIGALAALGVTDVEVYAKPRIAILSTGNEIAEPGAPLAPGQIYDINRFTLSAIIGEHGGVPVAHRTAQDTIDDLERAIDACLEDDVLVFSGGSSVGERDLILDVIGRRAGISSTPCASWATRQCRRSKPRATSRQWRTPTATSRFRRRLTLSRKVKSSPSAFSDAGCQVSGVRVQVSGFRRYQVAGWTSARIRPADKGPCSRLHARHDRSRDTPARHLAAAAGAGEYRWRLPSSKP